MMQRCFNPECPEYHNYGGREITVCERWHDAANFLTDMGKKPSPKHSLERINNNGNYDPTNCKWATQREQQRNKRTNYWIEWKGERLIITDWAIRLGLKAHTLHARISRGWSVERAFTTPLQTQYSHS